MTSGSSLDTKACRFRPSGLCMIRRSAASPYALSGSSVISPALSPCLRRPAPMPELSSQQHIQGCVQTHMYGEARNHPSHCNKRCGPWRATAVVSDRTLTSAPNVYAHGARRQRVQHDVVCALLGNASEKHLRAIKQLSFADSPDHQR